MKKKENWQIISDNVQAAGFEARNLESLKKKWSNVVAEEKLKRRNITGAGEVVWTAVNDLVVEVLGASNPKLVAIEGGMDTSSKEKCGRECQ